MNDSSSHQSLRSGRCSSLLGTPEGGKKHLEYEAGELGIHVKKKFDKRSIGSTSIWVGSALTLRARPNVAKDTLGGEGCTRDGR
jgi:hypothetical protein